MSGTSSTLNTPRHWPVMCAHNAEGTVMSKKSLINRSFLHGILSSFNLMPSTTRRRHYGVRLSAHKDSAAVRGDWHAVGNDMLTVMQSEIKRLEAPQNAKL